MSTTKKPFAQDDLNVRILQGTTADGRLVPEARLRLRDGRRPDLAHLLSRAVVAVQAQVPPEERPCWRVRSEILGDAEGRIYIDLEEGTLSEHTEGHLALHRALA